MRTTSNSLGRSRTKQRIFGGLFFFFLGLGFLAGGYFQPIHWAKMHPGKIVTIYPQLLMLGSCCELMALWSAVGLSFNNKPLALAMTCVGIGIGLVLRAMLISTLTAMAHAH